ncbi:GNAT family N-acetyltransferase [Candidatus Giovannonibacteria bacterium]|nr:GNAT family N-acetyltransferase [Candidatus Giovannonibacteria bacterium]
MTMTCDCELCRFRNPKPTATAVFIKDGKLFVLKRSIPPFQDKWDFMGGYIGENETPEECLRREIKEELNVGVDSLHYLGVFTGTGFYKEYEYPTLCFAYLAELEGEVKLNEENSEYAWLEPDAITDIAFDSNKKILEYLKKMLFNFDEVKKLADELITTDTVKEQSLYKALLNGYVSRVYDGPRLVGMGWIFPRQTMLRRQAVVEDMIVDAAYRGKGLGKKILLDLMEWAKSKGVEVVELTTNPSRVAANELYKKTGFVLHPTNHYLYFIEK